MFSSEIYEIFKNTFFTEHLRATAYSINSDTFIYKFVHAIIFLFIERKAISCLSVELPKIEYSCL